MVSGNFSIVLNLLIDSVMRCRYRMEDVETSSRRLLRKQKEEVVKIPFSIIAQVKSVLTVAKLISTV